MLKWARLNSEAVVRKNNVKNNVYEAMYRICGDNQSVTSGIGVIKTHEKKVGTFK